MAFKNFFPSNKNIHLTGLKAANGEEKILTCS